MSNEGSKICVVIRKRPINKKELNNGETDVVQVRNGETVIVSQYKQKVDLTKYIEESAFNFDHAFDQSCNNQQIYQKAVRPLVESAYMGARVTCFAYGQTGSGKTFTMNGDPKQGVPGLYILAAQDIFGYRNNVTQKQYSHLKITVSFFEIYCGKLFDLLNNRNQLKIREDNKQNIHIVGLKEDAINTPQEYMQAIEYGSNFRVTSQNSTNADSSRSHAILQICLKEGKKIYGKMSFIDLAGCERGADHMDQNKQTRIDGAEINKSLLSLKECIRALDQGKGHTPFRGSKLTMVLKDSFIGFCYTVMIGNISPNINSCENTLNTLRYADRVKELKKPGGNSEPLSKEDQLAKELMLPRNGKNAVRIMISNDDDAEDIMIKKLEAQKQLGIRNDNYPQKMMALQEPVNRPKNTTLDNKQPLKRLESQEARVLGRGNNNQPQGNASSFGFADKNSSNLFDNSKTVEMRPQIKQNTNTQGIFQNQSRQGGTQFQNQSQSQQQYQPQQYQQQNAQSKNQQMGSNQSDGYRNNYQASNQNQNNYGNQQNYNNQYQPDQYQYNEGPNYQQQNQYYNQSNNQGQNGYDQSEGPKRNSFKTENNFQFQSQPQSQPQPQPQPVANVFKQNNFIASKTNTSIQPQQYFEPQSNPYQFSQPQVQQQSQSQPQPQPQAQSKHQPQTRTNGMMVQQVPSQTTSFEPNQNYDWRNAVQQFKQWQPTQNQQELKYFREVHDYLITKLVAEEDTITSEHSQTINREIETIKGEMKFIQQLQKNKAAYESIEYVEFIEDMIDRKLSALVKLKKKVNGFKERLIEHQECEEKVFMAQDQLNDQGDELLLDNLDQEDY